MRHAEKLLVGLCLVVPLVVAGVGWPAFVRWIGGSGPTPQTEVAGAAATSVATGRAVNTPRPATPGLPPTVEPRTPEPPVAARTPGAAAVAAIPTPLITTSANAPAPASQASVSDPGAAVASFYQLIGAHQFEPAAQLWSPHMRAAYPPEENINQRFSRTQQVSVQRAEVVAMEGGQATVAVDLVEVTAANQQHYTGTWSLVHADTGWLLDQPNLQVAPG